MTSLNSSSRALFQSTLSVRRATHSAIRRPAGQAISIHALRKESDSIVLQLARDISISIHALRKESDQRERERGQAQRISIHALRKESD